MGRVHGLLGTWCHQSPPVSGQSSVLSLDPGHAAGQDDRQGVNQDCEEEEADHMKGITLSNRNKTAVTSILVQHCPNCPILSLFEVANP